jgi:hypothetical protein
MSGFDNYNYLIRLINSANQTNLPIDILVEAGLLVLSLS